MTYEAVQAHLDDRRRQAAGLGRHLQPPPRPYLTFTNTVDIARPQAEVFAFLEDFTNVPSWNYWVREVRRLDAGRVGVGTRFHQVRRDDEQRYRITAHEAPRRLVVATLEGERPAFTRVMDLAEVAGGTRLTDTWQLATGHPPVLQKLAGRRARDGVAANLACLKDLLETGRTVLPDGRQVRLP